jgi:two-component system response regulator FixJ
MSAPGHSLTGKTIVVVDDDADMNTALKRLLHAAGYQTNTYASAESFLETDPEASGDCLVLDINLPGLSGLELARQLRGRGIIRPVIFITAYDDPAYQQQAKDAGGIVCMTKPFPSQLLLSTINDALASKVVNLRE